MINGLTMFNDLNDKEPEKILELLRAYQAAINVNTICSITDRRGRIVYVNDKFCDISGYTREELLGHDHRLVNSGFHPKSFFAEMWESLLIGEHWHGEIRNRAKDGTFYWVETVILPIRNAQGTVVQFLSLRILITEKKVAEKQRFEYIEKLSHMLHMTNHRVRGPLTRCMGIMQLIDNRSKLSNEEFAQVIDYLKSSAQQLDDFTRDLTQFLKDMESEYRNIVPVSSIEN